MDTWIGNQYCFLWSATGCAFVGWDYSAPTLRYSPTTTVDSLIDVSLTYLTYSFAVRRRRRRMPGLGIREPTDLESRGHSRLRSANLRPGVRGNGDRMSTTQQQLDGSIESQPIYDEEGRKRCHECGEYYKGVGTHWEKGSCPYPIITDHQREIITGLMMGDGYMSHSLFTIHMTNKTFVEWVKEKLGYVVNGGLTRRDADEHENGRGGFENSDARDTYIIRTHSTPQINEFNSWYNNSSKKYPDELELTPMILKMWYVSDGSIMNQHQEYPSIRIAKKLGNKRDEQQLIDLFSRMGWEFERDIQDVGSTYFRFTISDSCEMWDYMGEAPPGFEYKWNNNNLIYGDVKNTHTTKTINGVQIE